MKTTAELWLYVPQLRLTVPELVAAARAAEASRFDGIAFLDHLVAPGAEDAPLYEAMTVATWVAAHTTTLRIGHLVLCDAMRSAPVLAKQAVTLDHASGGRFELGLGYGSWPSELAGFGLSDAPAKERAARLVESVATLRALWNGDPIGPGRRTQAPLPLARIPLVVGGVGPTALRLAREYADWWNVPVTELHRLPNLRDRVGEARVSAQVMVALDGPDEPPGAPLARARRWFPDFAEGILGGAVEEVCAHLAGLAAQGIERLYLWPAPPVTPESIGRLCAQHCRTMRGHEGSAGRLGERLSLEELVQAGHTHLSTEA